ncbi:hypothetical protein RhiirA5_478871 [Rhizophagus irregularis]|uniref:Uncharacterized protein n=2 Tax=Rhizophagus irregularis TaxID=588596 RepID=A0A2N0PLT0_9GLOM|nr:hypothetical protein RhiirA5_478871 [Rhizophagus irregularis]
MSKRKAVYNNQVEVETGTKKNPRTLSKKRREMNIEETNQLLLEKEVIVEDDVRDKSEDEDEEDEEDEDDDNDNDKLGAAKTVLDPFQFCTKLDICNWLLKNPDILRLANEMNESSYVVSSKNTEDKIRLWDESVKCLFLRARNLSSEALDDLVVKIFQFKIYTSEARSYLEKTRKSLIDFRNKFNQNILNLVEEYKKIRKSRGTTGNLSQKEIKEYVDENVMQKLLNRQLAAVNILELTNNGGTDTLVEFVKEAVRVSWDGKNLSGIKELDTMTKNLIIPSRSGSDIVNTLKQVRSYKII